jgi:hypothetical protein
MNNILKKIKNQVVVVVKLIITLNGHELLRKVQMRYYGSGRAKASGYAKPSSPQTLWINLHVHGLPADPNFLLCLTLGCL